MRVRDGRSPCFPWEVVDPQHFSKPGCQSLSCGRCEQAWTDPAPRPFLAALAPVLGMSRRRVRGWGGGPTGPFLAVPLVRKGRAVSLTIYSVLDKCK